MIRALLTDEQANKILVPVENPDYTAAVKLGIVPYRTPRFIRDWTVHGSKTYLDGQLYQLYQLPYGYRRFLSAPNIPHHNTVGQPRAEQIRLRDYQVGAVDTMLSAGYGILRSPAGSGKTVCGCVMINRLSKRTLWLAGNIDLLHQARETYARLTGTDADTSLFNSKDGYAIGDRVTFATIQSVSMKLTDFNRNDFGVIIVDECHHVTSRMQHYSMYQKVLNYFEPEHVFGLTATPSRLDGTDRLMMNLLGDVTASVERASIVDNLQPVDLVRLDVNVVGRESMSISQKTGLLNFSKTLTDLCNNEARNHIIADKIVSMDNHHVLVLSDRTSQLTTLQQMIGDKLGNTVIITGQTPKSERSQALQDFRDGSSVSVIFSTYQLAKEGLDLPNLEILVLASPKKDKISVEQAVGRLQRKCDGKTTATLVDVVDQYPYWKRMYQKRLTIYKKLLLKNI